MAVTETLIRDMVLVAASACSPDAIILFGSHAAGTKDLRALQGMSDPDVFADEVFGFHAQQAAEKALKAWLAVSEVEYPRMHDLSLLHSDLVELNPYSVQYRYAAFEDLGGPLDRCAVQKLVHGPIAAVSDSVDVR